MGAEVAQSTFSLQLNLYVAEKYKTHNDGENGTSLLFVNMEPNQYADDG